MNWSVSTFKRPFEMALGLYLLCFIIFLTQWGINNGEAEQKMEIYLYGAVACFLYGLFSALLLLFAKNEQKHWNQSMIAYFLLLGVHVLVAYLITGKSILELKVYRQILTLITIAFFVLITIAGLIKKVESWSRQQDNYQNK